VSGICGIVRLDGRPAQGLDGMLAFLQRRGPDGTRAYQNGPVALGHTLLATTPEALHEALPWTHEGTGCTITADARLDNRDELIAALGLPAVGRVVGDGEIILEAYLRWGEGCPGRLLGDWAFAIWDPRERRLLAARDQMGLRRLAYAHVPGRILAFATEPRAVRAAPDVPQVLDEGKIADFLEDARDEIDAVSTLYAAVRRVPPAHLLTVGPDGIAIRRYWSLEPRPPLRLGSDEAYAEAFLEVFTEAVRARLRNAGGLGSMLSGGMDSGSVTAVATRLLQAKGEGPLPTFSVVGPEPSVQAEAEAIRACIAALPGLDPHVADIGAPSTWLDGVHAMLRDIEEPFNSHMTLHLLTYLQAGRAGVRILLDGLGGDEVVSSGQHLAHIVRSGRWLDLWREAEARQRFWTPLQVKRSVIEGAFRRALIPDWARRWRLARQSRHWSSPVSPVLAANFARHVNKRARVELWHRNNMRPLLPPGSDRIASITSLSLLSGREHSDQLAGLHGIEPRDPFMDRRVIDLCLRCPPKQIYWNGWPKLLLRRAMKDHMPAEVIWRTGRTHFGFSMRQVLWANHEMLREGQEISTEVAVFLKKATGLTYGQEMGKNLSTEWDWNLHILALWLVRNAPFTSE
jgi:asparagine synthase (glutamine-hydrolysing)